MTGPGSGRPVLPHARVRHRAQLPAELDRLGVRRDRPVAVLVGGADGMDEDDMERMDAVFRAAVFPILNRHDVALVDGGTDSGVMRVVGRARAATGARFALIGVAAEGTVTAPERAAPEPAGHESADAEQRGADGGAVGLEPHHTHAVLVPGDRWGDESPWLADVATAIAGDHPSVTLVVNGGEITYDDIDHSVAADRPAVVLAGTGRTADAIAGAAAGRGTDARAQRLAASPLVRVVDIGDPAAITAALEAVFSGPARTAGAAAARPRED